MKFFKKRYDGGQNSGVTGYWFIEWKKVFSIVLLKFQPNHRENYHSHAFHALTWWVWGRAIEEFPDGTQREWKPSLLPKFTPKSNIHRYKPTQTIWAFSIRGPWEKTWYEIDKKANKQIHLRSGREVINQINLSEK